MTVLPKASVVILVFCGSLGCSDDRQPPPSVPTDDPVHQETAVEDSVVADTVMARDTARRVVPQ